MIHSIKYSLANMQSDPNHLETIYLPLEYFHLSMDRTVC